MQTKEKTAYELFLDAHALYTGKNSGEVQAEITFEQFEERIRSLYQQYMNGQFSMGRFTELAEVAHLELWEILNMMGLSSQ